MRVVFTVALAVAVAAVALPAVETAGVDRSAALTEGAVERLVAEARTLAAGNDALGDGSVAARRVVTLDLPRDGFAAAPLVSLTVGPPERRSAATQVAWRVDGGERRVRQFDGVRLRPATGDRFSLERGGSHRLVLRLVSRNGTRVVTVSRRSFK